jgi:hypothetical protein
MNIDGQKHEATSGGIWKPNSGQGSGESQGEHRISKSRIFSWMIYMGALNRPGQKFEEEAQEFASYGAFVSGK